MLAAMFAAGFCLSSLSAFDTAYRQCSGNARHFSPHDARCGHRFSAGRRHRTGRAWAHSRRARAMIISAGIGQYGRHSQQYRKAASHYLREYSHARKARKTQVADDDA